MIIYVVPIQMATTSIYLLLDNGEIGPGRNYKVVRAFFYIGTFSFSYTSAKPLSHISHFNARLTVTIDRLLCNNQCNYNDPVLVSSFNR